MGTVKFSEVKKNKQGCLLDKSRHLFCKHLHNSSPVSALRLKPEVLKRTEGEGRRTADDLKNLIIVFCVYF